MEKKIRINLILNGRSELGDVIDNLRKLFDFDDPMLLLTKCGIDTTKQLLNEKLGLDEKWFAENAYHSKFNAVDYNAIHNGGDKKLFVISMPNSLYHTISTGYNDGFKFVDKTEIARFIHVFADDCRIISKNYNPDTYEWFMTNFSVPFVMDSKTNKGNFAFKKYSPRFVFVSQKYLPQPISFVQYDAKDHFVVDRDVLKENFDEKLKRLYVPEMIMRLRKKEVIKHTSFYPDPVLEQWVERVNRVPTAEEIKALPKEYMEDEKYIKNELKMSLTIENAVDPIIKEIVDVIKTKLSNDNGTANDKENA